MDWLSSLVSAYKGKSVLGIKALRTSSTIRGDASAPTIYLADSTDAEKRICYGRAAARPEDEIYIEWFESSMVGLT